MDAAWVTRQIRFRRRLRVVWRVGVPLLVLSAVLDRAGAFGYRGDDWRGFDRKAVIVQHVINGDSFETTAHEKVCLLGSVSPESELARRRSLDYATGRIEGRTVLLRLDVPQTRDEQGRLLAYVYLNESDCLNVDLAREGWAFADRRVDYLMRSSIEAAEAEARKKGRGMWAKISADEMPAWRREWLAEVRRTRP